MSDTDSILEVRNLVKNFTVRGARGLRASKRIVQAVSDVSFQVRPGETLGLVGECIQVGWRTTTKAI